VDVDRDRPHASRLPRVRDVRPLTAPGGAGKG
jgi:hypothetical protein